MQQGVYNAFPSAAVGVHKLFVNFLEILDINLRLIVEHSNRYKLARLGPSSTHCANPEPRWSPTRAASDSSALPIRNTLLGLALAFLGAKDAHDYPGQYQLNVL